MDWWSFHAWVMLFVVVGRWCRGKPMGQPCQRKRLLRPLRNGWLGRPWAWILKLRDLYGLYRTVGLRDLELEFWRLEDLCGLCRTVGLCGFELESWNLETCMIFVGWLAYVAFCGVMEMVNLVWLFGGVNDCFGLCGLLWSMGNGEACVAFWWSKWLFGLVWPFVA